MFVTFDFSEISKSSVSVARHGKLINNMLFFIARFLCVKDVVVFVLGTVLPLVLSVLGLVVHLVVAHRLNCSKDLLTCLKQDLPAVLNSAKGVAKVKFKTVDDKQGSVVSQKFTPYEKDYILNPVSNELEEKPIPRNVQDYIQSYIDCALERALEKFLPKDVEESDAVIDYTAKLQELASLGEAMEIAEQYRDEFNLPDTYSMSDIYSFVDKQAKKIKKHIDEANKPKEDKSA